MKTVLAMSAILSFAACASSTQPAPPLAGTALSTLSLALSASGPFTTSLLPPGTSVTATVTPAGAPPYQGQIVGTCATLTQPVTTTSFTLSVASGVCVLVVADAAGRFRSLNIVAGPPRTFLAVNPVLPDTSGAKNFSIGTTETFTVDESLVQTSIGAPYTARVFGTCVSLAASNAPPNAAATFAIAGASAGQCVAVFADAGAGEAAGVNFTI